MAKKGDTYTIEIDSVFCDVSGKKLYRAKGFNSLVFDDTGINKLTKGIPQQQAQEIYNDGFSAGKKAGASAGQTEKSYQDGFRAGKRAGVNYVWDCMKRVFSDYPASDMEDIYDTDVLEEIFEKYKPETALDLLEKYQAGKAAKKTKSETVYRLGDVLKSEDCDCKFVITGVNKAGTDFFLMNKYGQSFSAKKEDLSKLHKTGVNHCDEIIHILW